MTGPEGAVLMMAMIAGVGLLITVYDWWTRRRDRTSSRR
jgi:hypothetical protein